MSTARITNSHEIKQLIEQLVRQTIDRQNDYDSDKCTQLSKNLSQIIKDAMKKYHNEQYKYVVQVVIGQCQDENLMITCRCLWDIQNDNYISFVYSNKKLFCAVTVFRIVYY